MQRQPATTGLQIRVNRGRGPLLSYRNPPPNHDCENMDMPAVVTPSVNVTDMACVGHVVYTIAFPQLCGLTPTFAWLYIHMSVTRWDVFLMSLAVQGIVLTKTTCTVTQQTLPAAVNLHEEASSSSC